MSQENEIPEGQAQQTLGNNQMQHWADLRQSVRGTTRKTYMFFDDDVDGGRRGTKYAVINDEKRMQFVSEIATTGCTIKCAAKKFGINFSTAKAIMQTYRREGRIGKKQQRETKKRKIQKLKAKLKTTLNQSKHVSPRPKQLSLSNKLNRGLGENEYEINKSNFEPSQEEIVEQLNVKIEQENLFDRVPMKTNEQMMTQDQRQNLIVPNQSVMCQLIPNDIAHQLYLRQAYENHIIRQQMFLKQAYMQFQNCYRY